MGNPALSASESDTPMNLQERIGQGGANLCSLAVLGVRLKHRHSTPASGKLAMMNRQDHG